MNETYGGDLRAPGRGAHGGRRQAFSATADLRPALHRKSVTARSTCGRRAASLAMVALAGAAVAHGTTLARMSLAQLAEAAQVIARVRCTNTTSRRDGDSIWTYTDLAVEETFKGAPGRQIAIRLPGGRDGHLVETVEGAPRFAVGDEAIVFLERTRSGGFSVCAWAEGTFRIARDSRTGDPTITQDSSATAVFDPATRTFHSDGIARMPLAEFRARLDIAMKSGGR